MSKRFYAYISKTDSGQRVAILADQQEARTRADAFLGLANWLEYDLTEHLLPACGELVNLARERSPTRDGTSRWRWRTIANVVKRWLGEPTDETCEQCGSRWPTAPAT